MARPTGRSAAGRPTAAAKAAIPQLAWDAVRPAPVVLVSGTETVLADRAIRQLRDILKAEDPSLEVSDIDAGSYAPGELLTLASPSLFGEPRLIRVENVEKMTDAFLDEGLAYLENPPDDCGVLLLDVVLGHAAHPDPASELARAIAQSTVDVVVSVIGTPDDPQDLAAQTMALRTAGASVFSSNAEATRHAVRLAAGA